MQQTVHSGHARAIALFACAFASVITTLRLLIVLRGDQPVTAQYIAGLPISFCLAGFYGLLFGYLAARNRGGILRSLPIWIALTIVLLVNVVSFHYEAVFGRLPGVQLLFYVGQIRELSPSLHSNLPAGVVGLEMLVAVAVLLAAWCVIRRRPHADIRVRTVWLWFGSLTLAIGISGTPGFLPDAMRWSSRDPLIWLAQSAFIAETYDLQKLKLSGSDFDRFLRLHGRADPGPVLDPAFPLCRPRPPAVHGPTGRSVIVLILEGVGQLELIGDFRGQPLMPNLRRIAGRSANFPHAVAPSTKSSQTLVALFSGLPPHPFGYYLWQTPLPNFDGLPRQLRDAGYDTVYFHGGDLAFERQRPYLRSAGFGEVQEYDRRRDLTSYGWGYDDATMFAELRRWIGRRKPEDPPYLAALFTLSTHDPYVLPGDWPPVFSPVARQLRDSGKCCEISGETDSVVAAAEAYRFLDAQIGEFYAWYEGLPDPPLLVMVGDHAPHLANDSAAGDGALRFDVVLILAGLGPGSGTAGAARDRPVALHDVPVTLAELLGIRVHPCMVGTNLLDEDPSPVMVYAAGPETMDQVQFWLGNSQYRYDRAADRYQVLRGGADPDGIRELESVRDFVEATFPVHYYMLVKNAYFPPPGAVHGPALSAVNVPLFAAHRGNLNGPSAPEVENSRAALDRAAASAVPWIEVDLQVTSDGIPVLLHDPVVSVSGAEFPVGELTLEELRALPATNGVLTLEEALSTYLPRKKLLIEPKPQSRLDVNSRFAQAIVSLLARHPVDRVVVDSFDEFLASSIKQQCGCDVGIDTPYREPLSDAQLDHYRRLDMDWIYVEHSVVDADLVRRAHARGLRVMSYTVNDPAVVDRWRAQGMLPDGIISDYEAIGAAWRDHGP